MGGNVFKHSKYFLSKKVILTNYILLLFNLLYVVTTCRFSSLECNYSYEKGGKTIEL